MHRRNEPGKTAFIWLSNLDSQLKCAELASWREGEGGVRELYMGSQAMATCHKMGVANVQSRYNDLPMMDIQL